MKITRQSDIDTSTGPGDYFTGDVTLSALHQPAGPERVAAVRVRFPAGARTAWHTHPLGQLLIVTDGEGWVQLDGEAKQVIGPGDVVWIAPGERHWHGATAERAMTHLAIQEAQNGRAADWEEQVSDADYMA